MTTAEPSTARRPPGPSGLAMLRRLRRLVTEDSATVLLDARRRHGRIVRLSLPGGGAGYLLADPEYVQHVLEANQSNYRKSEVYRAELRDIFGQGLLTSEGDHWARQHRLIRPMFRSDSVRSFADLVVAETDAMLDRWAERADRGEPIDLLAEMERVTLLIIGKAMFSADVEAYADEIGAAVGVLRREFQRQTSVLPTLPDWLPTDHNRRLAEARERLDSIVYGLIEDRRDAADPPEDLLTMLLSARDEETGEAMSDEQVRDEMVTFLLAGHETTAAALTWTWYCLARNPGVHERLHEAAGGASGRDADRGPPREPSLATRCVQEGMRLYPPVPVFSREAVDDDTVGGYRIPAGSDVLLSQFVVHRDPEVWEAPAAYRPDRFRESEATARPSYSYFPFGGGPRMCIGRQFALMEAETVLSRAVERFRLDLHAPADRHPGVDSAVTMVPDRTVEMTVSEW